MYLEHYGLTEPPFSITPDPRFVYLSERHRDALAHLLFGIGQGGGGGFVQLTGEVGTGKTTLCRLLLEQLPENVRVALVLNPRVSPVELLETICEELRIDVAGRQGSLKALVDALNHYLLDAYAQGLRVVLIIDEAQNLSVEALEQVRLLTNLETDTQKLLQIILLGQPELRELLARDDLRQLAQRITARYHLTPLDAKETGEYLRHNDSSIWEKLYFGFDKEIKTKFGFWFPHTSKLDIQFKKRRMVIYEHFYQVDEHTISMCQITAWQKIFNEFPLFFFDKPFMLNKSNKIARVSSKMAVFIHGGD